MPSDSVEEQLAAAVALHSCGELDDETFEQMAAALCEVSTPNPPRAHARERAAPRAARASTSFSFAYFGAMIDKHVQHM